MGTVVRWCCLAAAACSADAAWLKGDGQVTETEGLTDAPGTDPVDSTTSTQSSVDTGVPVTAEFYSFEIQFSTDKVGEWSKGSSVEVSLHDAADDVRVLCTVDVPFSVSPAAATELEGPVWSWWDLQLDDVPGSAGCPAWLAAEWRVGIGEYDVRLDPAVYAVQLQDAELLGLYLQEGSGPVYVVGVAGTLDMFAGVQGMANAPLAPGLTYVGRSLILLAL